MSPPAWMRKCFYSFLRMTAGWQNFPSSGHTYVWHNTNLTAVGLHSSPGRRAAGSWAPLRHRDAVSTKADGGKGVTPIRVVEADSIMSCGVSSTGGSSCVTSNCCGAHGISLADTNGEARDNDPRQTTTLALHQRQNGVTQRRRIHFSSLTRKISLDTSTRTQLQTLRRRRRPVAPLRKDPTVLRIHIAF